MSRQLSPSIPTLRPPIGFAFTACGVALVVALGVALPAAAQPTGPPAPPGPPSPSPNLADRVDALETLVAQQGALIAALQAENAAQDARLAAVEGENVTQDGRLASLEGDAALLASVLYVDGEGDLIVEGANLRIVNGRGATSLVNGKGNLIVGYDETGGNDARGGSHNLVVGQHHAYSSYGGFVAGFNNESSAPNASVLGGANNRALGFASAVVSGQNNWAIGTSSAVTGGQQNIASGFSAAVNGGLRNTAAGPESAVAGGADCLRGGSAQWGFGGNLAGLTGPVILLVSVGGC